MDKISIAIADDNVRVAQLLENIVNSDEELEVVGKAENGEVLMDVIHEKQPDVVLMDIKMPVFDGMTASETLIREELCGCVVLLTAFQDQELIERAGRIGVTGYLVKPVEERRLLPTLEVAMAQAARLREARREAEEMKRQMEEQKLIQRAKALLAKSEGTSEGEAYRRLQRLAMEKRCALVSLCQAVVAQQSGRETLRRAKEQLMARQGLSEPEAYQAVSREAKARGLSLEEAARALLEGGAP